MAATCGVLGAGCIGGFLGGALASAGLDVVLVGRPALQQAVAAHALEVRPLGGPPRVSHPRVETDVEALAQADIVLVTVKGRDTTAAARALAPVIKPGAVVVSFQNGLRNPARLASVLPDHEVVAGMVSFNVVWEPPATFRQATSGPVALGHAAPPVLVHALQAAGLPVHLAADMERVQWAKLVLNLNNAVNALSGLSLRDELSHREYRRVLAVAVEEAWAVMRAAGIRPAPIGRMKPRLAPKILPLPDTLFRVLAASMIRIDPAARSSMADDLARGRPTEVDDINGEIVALGRQLGVPTPVNAHLVELVHQAETAGKGSPGLPPEALRPPG